MLDIKIMLEEGATCPTYSDECASGLDLYAYERIVIVPGVVTKVRTGVRIELPDHLFGDVRLRSGTASRNGMVICSSGVVDPNYRGECYVPVTIVAKVLRESNDFCNPSGFYALNDYVIEKGERFAQLLLMPQPPRANLIVCDALNETCRGENGFGSSGRN